MSASPHSLREGRTVPSGYPLGEFPRPWGQQCSTTPVQYKIRGWVYRIQEAGSAVELRRDQNV